MAKWAEKCFKVARLALQQTEDAPLRRNGAFFLGVLVEQGLVTDLPTVLQLLHPLFVNPGGRNAYKWDLEVLFLDDLLFLLFVPVCLPQNLTQLFFPREMDRIKPQY